MKLVFAKHNNTSLDELRPRRCKPSESLLRHASVEGGSRGQRGFECGVWCSIVGGEVKVPETTPSYPVGKITKYDDASRKEGKHAEVSAGAHGC